MPTRKSTKPASGPIGYESQLWQMADALRNNMDAAEYKHVVLGLLFLKYISDAFEAKHAELEAQSKDGADPEDRDEYRAASIFWVPKEARWSHLKASAPQPTIGTLVDDAMAAIERDNGSLKGVLPKDYGRPGLDKQRLGQIINLVSDIALGSEADRAKDTLGRVYEYFLARFASAEGKSGGQFYTPAHVVRVLVEMLAPYKGRVYDPCCGSGGMFVQSEKFIEAHSGKIGDISIYGQESNYTTWRLAAMNLAIRGIDAQIAHGDTFHADRHPDLKADYVLANPPFNDSDWRGDLLRDDKRWVYGAPPAGNANFAWVQHFIHHLAPTGLAGFVLANGSMSSNQSGEGEIRKAIIEADLVDCMVALPGQLFYSTQIPVCLWFVARSKKNGRFRDRRGETLFIDARKLGTLVDRVHRELTEEDIARISPDDASRLSRYQVRAGDIVYSRRGDVERQALITPHQEGWLCGTGCLRVRLGENGMHPRFASYYFGHPGVREWIVRHAHGATMPNLNTSILGDCSVLVPPSAAQRSIAEALGALDDKIDLNRRMSETLEAMARALFTSWFVDFDPVRAKAEERDTSLPKHIADLFPESFEESELGEIPRGWCPGSIGDVAENPRRGVQPQSIDPSTPYIALEHMPRRSIALDEWAMADGLESNKFHFKSGERLFGKLRPYFHKVGVAPLDGVCSTDIVVVAPLSASWFGFVLGHVSSDIFIEYTNAGSTGTKMPRTNWSEMARYPCACPPEPVSAAFTRLIGPSVDRIVRGIHESRALAALRDTLLPKLLSGSLRIPNVEQVVGTAL